MTEFDPTTDLVIVCEEQVILHKRGLGAAHFHAEDPAQAKLILSTFLAGWRGSDSYQSGLASLLAFVLFIQANACPDCLAYLCAFLEAECEDGCTDPHECASVVAEAVLTALPDEFSGLEEMGAEVEPEHGDALRWN